MVSSDVFDNALVIAVNKIHWYDFCLETYMYESWVSTQNQQVLANIYFEYLDCKHFCTYL